MSSLPNVNTTLGAIFIGNIVSGILYGVTTLQTYMYFGGKPRDPPSFRLLIGILWILDTIQMAFMTHGVYQYLILNYWIGQPPWSILSQVIVTCMGDLIVRCIFAWRIWLLSGYNKTLVFSILVAAILVFASGMAYVARGFIDGTYAKLALQSWLLYTALGSSVLADVLVTIALCVLLDHRRSGFKSTDSLVDTIMVYSINTGALTSICAAACFITYSIWPHSFIYIGIYFVLSKLYITTILVVLNTRESLDSKNPGMRTIPDSPSAIEPMAFIRSFSNGHRASIVEPAESLKLSFQYKPSPV